MDKSADNYSLYIKINNNEKKYNILSDDSYSIDRNIENLSTVVKLTKSKKLNLARSIKLNIAFKTQFF